MWPKTAFLISLALPLIASKAKQDSLEIVVGLGQTADGLTSEVEAIDIYDPSKSCSLPNYPYSAMGAIGFYQADAFCGGHNSTHYFSDCHFMNEEKIWEKGPEMQQKRAYGAAAYDIVFGGFTGTESLASTEYIGEEGTWTEAYPDLPVKLHQHCVVYLLLLDHMVIGGILDGQPSNKTYIFNTLYERWEEGPVLNVARSGANCAYIDGYSNIVVAGGYNNDGHLSSTEVLNFEYFGPSDLNWKFGPELPEPICCAGQFGEENDLFVIGGSRPDGTFSDAIYMMSSVESGWTKLEAKLKTPRSFPAVSGGARGHC